MGKGTQRLKNIFTDNVDEINQGYTINSWHVSQSVEAFTGTGSFDIDVSGSVTVSGSIYHVDAQDAGGALSNVVVRNNTTGEYFITGSYGGGGGGGSAGSSGTSGSSGSSGSSGTSGTSGSSGSSGTSGTDGSSGSSGTSGTSGSSGSSGTSGTNGSSGSSGTSGTDGSSGSSGTSGTSGSSISFTRPGSATSITYDTYLLSSGYAVDTVSTSPAAPNANGEVSVKYAVSNIGSNVDRIDVFKTASAGGDNSNTLENLAISGSITLTQVGGGSHTERYTIVSSTDNTTYMSYTVDWVSGDDAAITTGTTDTFTFFSDYSYELSTGYNRLSVVNNSASGNQRFRMVKPSAASAGDEVIVELARGGGQNLIPIYQIRNGNNSVIQLRNVYEVDGSTVSTITLISSETIIMRFQVNDLGSVEGLTLLGANQIIF